MTPELAAYSNWVLALLPRLFLYPGGLGLLVGFLLLRLALGGRQSISPRILFTDLSGANLLSIAVAWATIALTPFPGTGLLPSPVDRLVLASLPALSMLLDITTQTRLRVLAGVMITLALVLPALEAGSLLAPSGSPTLLTVATLPAIILGLLAIEDRTIGGQVRWLAWFSLGTVPLLSALLGDNPWTVSLVVLAGALILGSTKNRVPSTEYRVSSTADSPGTRYSVLGSWYLVIAWLLVLPELLWALLAGL